MGLPSIHLQSMQADSLITAARQLAQAEGKVSTEQANKHFQKTVTAFFKTTNDAISRDELMLRNPKLPNIYQNAITALFTSISKAEEENIYIATKPFKNLWNKIFREDRTVREFLSNAIEQARDNNEILDKEVRKFFYRFSKFHPKTYNQRLRIASSGMVQADKIVKTPKDQKRYAVIGHLLDYFSTEI